MGLSSIEPNLGSIHRSNSGTCPFSRRSNRRRSRSTCTHGAYSKLRRTCQSTIGGKCRTTKGFESLQLSWGGNEIGLQDQSEEQAAQLEENSEENPIVRLNTMEALTAEAETGEALDVATAEVEDVRAMITE